MTKHLLPPSVSGNYYCIEDLLGAGSFGKVYQGYNLAAPHVPVAVKLPRMELKLSGILQGYQRTMREAGLLQRTSSPQVVQCLDYSRDSSFPYVVMEYVPQTLATVSITSEIIEDTVAQLPEIMAALYDAHIVHCDLREQNIGYVDRTLKLLDFGLAIPFEHFVIDAGRQVPKYFPPEFRRFNMITRTTDTYSAGRVLEHLLTREYSSSPTRAIAKMKEVYGREPPRSFQRLLRKMLRPDHYLRPDPAQLRELSAEALRDIRTKRHFDLNLVAVSSTEISFFGDSSS